MQNKKDSRISLVLRVNHEIFIQLPQFFTTVLKCPKVESANSLFFKIVYASGVYHSCSRKKIFTRLLSQNLLRSQQPQKQYIINDLFCTQITLVFALSFLLCNENLNIKPSLGCRNYSREAHWRKLFAKYSKFLGSSTSSDIL